MRKKIMFVNRKPPYGHSDAHESFDALLMASAFNQQISIAFMDDGVFQLMKQQDPRSIEMKNFSKMVASLEYFDIENIFIEEASLHSRGLTLTDLAIKVKPLSSSALAEFMHQQDVILSF